MTKKYDIHGTIKICDEKTLTVASLASGLGTASNRKRKHATHSVRSIAGVIGLLALVVACTPVPKQEFKAYTEAFDSAKQSIEQALVDMDAAEVIVNRIKESRKKKTKAAPTIVLSVELSAGPGANISESVKRRKALEAVSRFNDVMIALAEGRTDDEVKQTVDGFISNLKAVSDLVGVAIPGSSVITGTITTVVGLLQKAENRAQFIEAMKQAGPVVDKILIIFTRDAERVFALLAKDTNGRLKGHKDSIFDLWLQMKEVAAEYRAPAGTELPKSHKKVADDLKTAFATTNQSQQDPLLPTGGPGAPKVYDAVALSQLQQTLKQAQEAATAYRAEVEQHRARMESVVAYGRLLSQTRNSLAAVLVAMDRPPDIRAQALDLIGFAFESKRKLETWRAADRATAVK